MKKFIVIAGLLLSTTAFAGPLPKALRDLVPASGSVDYQGQDSSGASCAVRFEVYAGIFMAEVGDGGAGSADFQVGLGYNIDSLTDDSQTLEAVAIHKAEESYSSDARVTLTVSKDGQQIRSVHVLRERKGWFGYETEVEATCNL